MVVRTQRLDVRRIKEQHGVTVVPALMVDVERGREDGLRLGKAAFAEGLLRQLSAAKPVLPAPPCQRVEPAPGLLCVPAAIVPPATFATILGVQDRGHQVAFS